MSIGLVKVWILSFCLGVGVELFMIKARIGKETFYETLLRKETERRKQKITETYTALFPNNQDADGNVS